MWNDGQPRPGLPPAVKTILISTIVLFLMQGAIDRATHGLFTYLFALNRFGLMQGHLWQLVTYMFLHGGILHLFLNLLVVYMFGRELETLLGVRRFLILYLGSGILGGIGWVLLGGRGFCIGASGGVFGLIGMFATLFPNRPITLLLFFVFPVTMSARTMAILLGAITCFSMFGDGDIAHSAHLVGGLAGFFYGRRLLSSARRGGDTRLRRYFSSLLGALPRRRGWGGAPRSTDWTRDAEVLGPEPEPPPTEAEINAILDRILDRGVGSLTAAERRLLERASEEL